MIYMYVSCFCEMDIYVSCLVYTSEGKVTRLETTDTYYVEKQVLSAVINDLIKRLKLVSSFRKSLPIRSLIVPASDPTH